MNNNDYIEFDYFFNLFEEFSFKINSDMENIYFVYEELHYKFNEILKQKHLENNQQSIEELADNSFTQFVENSSYFGSHFSTDDEDEEYMNRILRIYYENHFIHNDDEGYDDVYWSWYYNIIDNFIKPYMDCNNNSWVLNTFTEDSLRSIITAQ